ncbi:PREDICTED: uncharacterized protein LOC106750355 isoform X2 [Dinoponera quadriceps]|uniref:Uncharacterized protein LOC106750355 isoform X2 n=1 Tax=Dinoponera quadriceps TaxID=609295 RepID=A0A6P3Y7Y8_DINQU|nr:PREDICTED: uncharacterized protein LOC106750355 isoform X2 [Dinoponera quadriceps]
MNVTGGVRVRIFEEERCVYERELAKSDGGNLKTLLRDLREAQSGVNDYLTTLIQRQDAKSGSARNTTDRSISLEEDVVDTEEEEEEEEETRVNPKK